MDFYNAYTYEQLAVCVKIVEDNSSNRTIHKAKGDEFENVLVILRKADHLSFLLSPNLAAEQQRVFYVAVSRGKDRLFINVPDLDAAQEAKLASIIAIQRLP